MTTRRHAFTLIELLVVIAIIALLMSILMPSLSRVRKQARAVACLANLKQWGYIWHMYTEDSNGRYNRGNDPQGGDAANDWPVLLMPYYQDRGALALCPAATRLMVMGGPYAFRAYAWDRQGWGNLKQKETQDLASYGENEWICDRSDTQNQYWRTRNNVVKADTVPLFFDCGYVDAWPSATAGPPLIEGDTTGYNEWTILCFNRHSGHVNYLFADLSVRKVGLKELWTLKWNRTFNTANAFTAAGGMTHDQWPPWLRALKDY